MFDDASTNNVCSPNSIRVLFIDSNVPQYQMFIDYVTLSTVPIVYSNSSTKSEILQTLQQVRQATSCTQINRIGFVFESNGPQYLFLDEQPMFLPGGSPENTQFIIDIIKEFNVQNVDFLACNTLMFPEWKTYYALLSTETGVIVGASDNHNGNIKYGADWVTESTCQEIELVYFTENISYYTFLLGGDQDYTVIATTSGKVFVTGYNGDGNLGLGTTTSPITFTQVDSSNLDYKTVKQISVSASHTILLMTDGTIYGAGYPQFYNQNVTMSANFTQIPNTTGKQIKQVACGASFVLLLMTDGTVYIAGTNGLGELSSLCDVGSSLSNFTQYVMPTGTQISNIGTYYSNHIVFVMADGSLYGTGYNLGYQLGFYGGGANGNTNVITNISIPIPDNNPSMVPISGYSSNPVLPNKLAKTVWCGGLYTCVLMTDGTLYFAGKVPGIGIRSYGLIQSPDLPSGKTVDSISCGGNHLILLMTDGTIYGLGSNVNGNLGFHPMVSILREFTPIPIPDDKTVSKVACGGNHTVVLMTDGTLYGTGYRGNGQLGGISPTRQYGLTQLVIPNNETVSLIMDELPAP